MGVLRPHAFNRWANLEFGTRMLERILKAVALALKSPANGRSDDDGSHATRSGDASQSPAENRAFVTAEDIKRAEDSFRMGQISQQKGALRDAARHFKDALRFNPDFSRACKELCELNEKLGEGATIKALLEECVSRSPKCADYRLWLSEVCEKKDDARGVANHMGVAIELGVRTVKSYMTYGAALCRIGRMKEGEEAMLMAEAMDPSLAYLSQYHLGYCYLLNGDVARGLRCMEASAKLRPDFLPAYGSMLMTLGHAGSEGEDDYKEIANRYAEAVKHLVGKPHRGQAADDEVKPGKPKGKLRVGFVSGDFYDHSVAFFLHDVLANLDQRQIHLVAYANNPVDDGVTERLKRHFDDWYSIRGLTDGQAASLIASHGIDVLVDLGGHTGHNRVSVFAHRPAATQIAWLGYWASTGLQEMDYILSDPVSTPADSKQWFSEKVYRLPQTRMCMSEPLTSREIDVAPAPCLHNGYITFGSFQQAAKITARVLSVWSRAMAAVPKSRLRIQTSAVNSDFMREELIQRMIQAGIEMSRVHLLGHLDFEGYLEAHNEVDVLLDTFPSTGGTTTFLALWMGTPTVTLLGDSLIARQGASILHCAGLDDWVASSEDEFVDIAVRQTASPAKLSELHLGLRDRALKSPLFDAKRFAADLQAALFHLSGESSRG